MVNLIELSIRYDCMISENLFYEIQNKLRNFNLEYLGVDENEFVLINTQDNKIAKFMFVDFIDFIRNYSIELYRYYSLLSEKLNKA